MQAVTRGTPRRRGLPRCPGQNTAHRAAYARPGAAPVPQNTRAVSQGRRWLRAAQGWPRPQGDRGDGSRRRAVIVMKIDDCLLKRDVSNTALYFNSVSTI